MFVPDFGAPFLLCTLVRLSSVYSSTAQSAIMSTMLQNKQVAPAQAVDKPLGEHHETTIEHVKEVHAAIARTDSHLDSMHIALGWRSWLVVLVTMFA